MRALLVLSLGLVLSCAHGSWGTTVASEPLHDDGWRAYTSAHFVLYTDQSDFLARSTLEEIEHGIRILQAVAFPKAKLPEQRIEVLLFDRAEQVYELYGDKQAGGYFRGSDDVTFEPHLLVLSAPRGGIIAEWSELREMALHEWAHGFVRHLIPRAPTWLNEGLATYWMTMEIDPSTREVIVGRPTYLVPAWQWPPLADVVGADAHTFYDRADRLAYYAASWGVVHFMYERHPEEIERLTELLAGGVSQQEAWRKVIGVEPAALDRQLRPRYGTDEGLAHRLPRPPLPPVDPESVRPLAPADVHVLWARGSGWDDDAREKRARQELDAAEKLAPDSANVQRWQAEVALERGRVADAVTHAERGVAIAPEQPQLRTLLAFAYAAVVGRRPEGERDYRALDDLFGQLAATSSSATALRYVAMFTNAKSGPQAALPLAERAVAKNRECVGCLDLLAQLRHALHDETGAVDAESRAVAAWPREGAPTHLLRRLAAYKRAAAAD